MARGALVAALLALPGAAAAAAGQGTTPPPRVVSLNPLGLVIEYFDLEFEYARTPTAAGALSFSHIQQNDARFTSADLKLKLYPAEHAPGGFAVAASAGYTHVRSRTVDCTIPIGGSEPCTHAVDEGNALSTGIELDQTWMLGSRKRFTVLLGLGVKRLYFIGDRVGDVDAVQPVLRFTVGHAF